MRSKLLTTIPLLLVLSVLATPAARAAGNGWTDDFAAAKAQAVAEDKDLFLYFTGSEWCLPCVMMDKTVFSTPAFRDTAPDDFVLVELDFPEPRPNPGPPTTALMMQNRVLQSEYNARGFPTIILADAQGRPYATTGYRPGGAADFLTHLDDLRARGVARDRALDEAANAAGLDKARALDRAINIVGIEFALSHYTSVIEEILALDSDNVAGLQAKYGPAYRMTQINADFIRALESIDRGDFDAGVKNLDRIVEDFDVQGEHRQQFKVVAGQVLLYAKRPAEAAAYFREAIVAAPESPVVTQIQQLLVQAQAAAEASG